MSLKRIITAIGLLGVFATSQLFLGASFAQPSVVPDESVALVPQQTAILTTQGNKPITVNGVSAISGATVMTGAMIETPDQVGAVLSIPGHFTLDIAPRAKVSVQFDLKGIKVNVIQGCVVLHTTKDTTGEIDTSKGTAGTADGSKDSRLDICDPSIATAPAAAAGGLSTGAKIAIVGAVVGAVALIPILTGGSNPSPGAP